MCPVILDIGHNNDDRANDVCYDILPPSNDVRCAPVYRFFQVTGNIKKCIQHNCKFVTDETKASNLERHLLVKDDRHVKANIKLQELKVLKSTASTSGKRAATNEITLDTTTPKVQQTLHQSMATKYQKDDPKQVREGNLSDLTD